MPRKPAKSTKTAKKPAAAPVPLEIRSIAHSYGSAQVLKGIDLSLKPGEIFGLIGLNGAGKTTLIKSILDLITPKSGSVQLFGKPATEAGARRNLCYLPEKFQPSSYLKGMEFLSLASAYYHAGFTRDKAKRYAEKLGLDPEVLPRRVGGYSKGMGQKLGLISAFLSNTKLLILDEPMSGLDPHARVYLKRTLREYADVGNTIFFSSHILADMEEICDRIAVLSAGKLVFTGTPGAFKKKYHGKGITLEEAFLKAIAA